MDKKLKLNEESVQNEELDKVTGGSWILPNIPPIGTKPDKVVPIVKPPTLPN